MKHIYFVSLGCDKNTVNSEALIGALTRAGFGVCTDVLDASAVVINTCGFIREAVQESIDTILEFSEGDAPIVVTGCMVNRYREEILKELPEVAAVVSPNDSSTLVAELCRLLGVEGAVYPRTEDYENRILTTMVGQAYIKIAEGCNHRCTYCTIPAITGDYKSREPESILREAVNLAKRGVREVTVVAQDTSCYGADLSPKTSLAALLTQISGVAGIEWIRVMYAYPDNIDDELINVIRDNPKICHYLDVPIQHASDKVLRLMGRDTTKESLQALFKKLREKITDISIRTTIITGFFGEGKEEFNELLEFVKEVKFDKLGVFEYSEEEGTAALSLGIKAVSEKTREKRKEEIMLAQQSVSGEILRGKVGTTQKVLVESIRADGKYVGRTYADCPELDGNVIFSSDRTLCVGDFEYVKICASDFYDLFGSA
ncbi:ribosomal protein S12 methylthiotransferase RimO [Clostridia bacterium]|nr:ribosomal protein S12 methylthiotransferase RimO [Clostridia bacterium]